MSKLILPKRRRAQPAERPSRGGASDGVPPYEPDLKSAVNLVVRLMASPGKSGQESQVVEFITKALRRAGAKQSDILVDQAHRSIPLGGEVGNLIFTLNGTQKAPRRLLMAHMDTVPLCVGAKPVRKGAFVHSADKSTGLGADDRAGCAVLLTAAIEILRRKLPHPPLTFFWPVQEEVGLYGAHYVKLGLLGKPRLAFNWDGGPAEKVTIAATGAYRMTIDIHGLASHAGGAPEHGISAVTIAGLAISRLAAGSWLGDVRQGDRHGTSNIGVIQGGAATNVVTDHVRIRAECRSHDPVFRKAILEEFMSAFREAAAEVRSASGACGRAEIASQLDYESFQLATDEPCVLAAQAAIRAVGGTPQIGITNGGLDANWLSARGIPTVTMGCGQENVHTTSERLNIQAFELACRVGLRLATATES